MSERTWQNIFTWKANKAQDIPSEMCIKEPIIKYWSSVNCLPKYFLRFCVLQNCPLNKFSGFSYAIKITKTLPQNALSLNIFSQIIAQIYDKMMNIIVNMCFDPANIT